ncbi:hypothetical protein LY28_02205 [Ruminiclostridium sufflavum DSM 19573]|uniref:Uncharacterized protein n=1 Tax=Ruminiclostridium sufflavum DSM 19573 TaxID=1121337 RepID=A0A318XJC3_9FIRM|nr:hypothetical protein [Ruminiclostridium sufflavum]PYG87300.1 hypothetical protein LY28_02205 [Ruminiclostridium sufflavum DSM 19573]
MIKKQKLYYKHYIILFSFLFFIGMIISVLLAKETAYKILSSSYADINVFYWLNPKFCVIQTGNFILLKGGIFSSIFGIVLPESKQSNILLQILSILKKLVMGTGAFLLTSIFTLYFLEKILIPVSPKQNININILIYSVKMFIAVYIFLIFWAIIGHGIKLTFCKIPIALIIGISVQFLEIYGIFYYLHSPFLKYLPTALSRQIVVYQFPCWEYGSWANVKSAFPFASSPIIIDKYYQFVKVSYVWIFCFLTWYVLLVYIKPFLKYITNNSSKNEVYDIIK